MAPPAGEVLALTDDNLAEILIRLPTLRRLPHLPPRHHRPLLPPPPPRPPPAASPRDPLLRLPPGRAAPPSAAAAAPFADANAADFSCSFLPSKDRWRRRDIRDGRVLLAAVPEGSDDDYDDRHALARDLAVCDPIRRRYLLLPAISDDLVALVDQQQIVAFEPFLASACDEDEEDISFRVICLAQCKSKLVVFVFTSGTAQWHASEFHGWGALILGTSNPDPGFESELSTRYYAHRCFCWVMHWMQKLLVLDTRTMEFSSLDIPPTHPMHQRATVEAGEGRFGIFTVRVDMVYGKYELLYTVLRTDVQGANQQQTCEIVPLPLNYRYNIMGVSGGYLLLQGIPEDLYSFPLSERPNLICFSLDLKTLKHERFCETKYAMLFAQLYAGFPPSLSPPTI